MAAPTSVSAGYAGLSGRRFSKRKWRPLYSPLNIVAVISRWKRRTVANNVAVTNTEKVPL